MITQEQGEQLAKGIIALMEEGQGFDLKESEDGSYTFYKKGEPYKLSEEEMYGLKIFLNTLEVSKEYEIE